jgi:hypothetical protein
VKGNHDDPSYFNEEKVSASRLRHNIIIYSTLLQVSFGNHNFTHINRI